VRRHIGADVVIQQGKPDIGLDHVFLGAGADTLIVQFGRQVSITDDIALGCFKHARRKALVCGQAVSIHADADSLMLSDIRTCMTVAMSMP
jgi:hypothetical protein